MSEYSKSLYVHKNNTDKKISLYTSSSDCLESIPIMVINGTKLYACTKGESDSGLRVVVNGKENIIYQKAGISIASGKVAFEVSEDSNGKAHYYPGYRGVTHRGAKIQKNYQLPDGIVSNVKVDGRFLTLDVKIPLNCTKIACVYTWHNGGDEHGHVRNHTLHRLKKDGDSKKIDWWAKRTERDLGQGNTHPIVLVDVTPLKTYTLYMSVSSYKDRNYGTVFWLGPSVNGWGPSTLDDR